MHTLQNSHEGTRQQSGARWPLAWHFRHFQFLQAWNCCSAGLGCHTFRKCALTANDRALARALMPRPLSTWYPSAPCMRGLPANRPCKFFRKIWVLHGTNEEHNSFVPFSLSYSTLPNLSTKNVSKTSLLEGMRIN